jgi:hypothetical protein
VVRRRLRTDASGRFRFMLLCLGGVVIVGLLLWFMGVINEPVRFGGFALRSPLGPFD